MVVIIDTIYFSSRSPLTVSVSPQGFIIVILFCSHSTLAPRAVSAYSALPRVALSCAFALLFIYMLRARFLSQNVTHDDDYEDRLVVAVIV